MILEAKKMAQNTFIETEIIHKLKHYLPSQTPLKDFIHHNSLHAFQNQIFFEAIFKASKIFGFQQRFHWPTSENFMKLAE